MLSLALELVFQTKLFDCEAAPAQTLCRSTWRCAWADRSWCCRTGKRLLARNRGPIGNRACEECENREVLLRKLYAATRHCLQSMPIICIRCCRHRNNEPVRQLPDWRALVTLAEAMRAYCGRAGITPNMCMNAGEVDADLLGQGIVYLLQPLRDILSHYEELAIYHGLSSRIDMWITRVMHNQLTKVIAMPDTMLPLYEKHYCICRRTIGSNSQASVDWSPEEVAEHASSDGS